MKKLRAEIRTDVTRELKRQYSAPAIANGQESKRAKKMAKARVLMRIFEKK